MEPTRSSGLVDLIDRILDKGIVLHADIIISVSGIPLIGVNFKAAIAGMKTMLDYGMMEAWDESLRRQAYEIEEDERAPLIEGEKIILKTFGEVLSNFATIYSGVWQSGYIYLTNKRLFLFKRKPPTILFETTLKQIVGTNLKGMDYIGRVRKVISIHLANGFVRCLFSNRIIELRDEIERMRGDGRLLVSAQAAMEPKE